MIPSLPLRVLTRAGARLALRQTRSRMVPRSRVSLNDKPVARYNQRRSNKSLDASGTSGLVFDILSITWLLPAALTQPLCAFFIAKEFVI